MVGGGKQRQLLREQLVTGSLLPLKEVKVGGGSAALQRLPRSMGHGLCPSWCVTHRLVRPGSCAVKSLILPGTQLR